VDTNTYGYVRVERKFTPNGLDTYCLFIISSTVCCYTMYVGICIMFMFVVLVFVFERFG